MTTLTTQQRLLVSQTFEDVVQQSARLSDLFYQRFFELDPTAKTLFKTEMTAQGFKLIQMLSAILNSMERPERFLATVEELGVRHQGYGVAPEQYQTAGEALLWSLEQILDADFTEQVKEAWTATYQWIAETAITSANNQTEA